MARENTRWIEVRDVGDWRALEKAQKAPQIRFHWSSIFSHKKSGMNEDHN